MKKYLLFALAVTPYLAQAQRLHGDLQLGVANYQGDLQNKRFTLKGSKAAVGIGLSYDINNHIIVRTLATYLTVTGDDKNGRTLQNLNPRNLNFTSHILEGQVALEYNLFDLSERSATPYVFAGVGIFHFNPYSYDSMANKVFLRSLSTEGQGLAAYPNKKLYKNNQFSIPFGVGVKFAVSEKVQVGLELGLRKLFTDYLDDVSGTYADSSILLAAKGPKAIAFAYRESEIHGTVNYPKAGDVRGNPKIKDWYYTTGVRISYLFGGSGNNSGTKHSKMGCPTNVY